MTGSSLPSRALCGQIAAELVQHQRGGRRALTPPAGLGLLLRGVTGQQLQSLLTDPVQIGAQLDQNLGGDTLALPDQAEKDVLGADVAVAEL